VRARGKRWTRRALISIVAAVFVVAGVFQSGLAEHWMRRALIGQIERRTGTRVQIGGFHFHVWRLQAEIDDLTLHGLEGPGEPPLFHADRVDVAIRVLSFFGRQIALDKLIVEHPQVAVRIGSNGRSNLPAPKVRARKGMWRETLFRLRIGRLDLRDGSVTFNNRRVPLAVVGRNFEFALHYEAPPNAPDSYAGQLRWQQVELAQRRYLPFRFDLSAKFTLHRDAFELDELVWKLPHSEIDLRAELPSFARSDWNLRYRGWLSLADVRTIFRAPKTPDGIVDFSGQAHYASATARGSTQAGGTRAANAPGVGEWTASGYYHAHDIRMAYQWFHAGGIETSGDYDVAQRRLVVPNLRVRALGGAVNGRLEMDFDGLAFRTDTHLHGASLGSIFAALDNPDFPVHALHWDGVVDADSENTWNANFRHFRTKGETRWSPPATPAPGLIPVTARIEYDYSEDLRKVEVAPSEITTPKAQVNMNGMLGAADSAMEVKFQTDELADWGDFINVLRGPDAASSRIAGKAAWRGRILGPITGPTFIGHVQATDARYNKLYWTRIDGDLEYSPDDFRLTKTVVQRVRTSAALDLALELDGDWSFIPSSPWRLDARIEHAPSDDLQALFETNYPVSGFLSGDFHGSGTRAHPMFDANFVYEDIEARGFHFDRLSGQLHVEHDEVRFSGAELDKAGGRIAGDFLYRFQEQQATFDLTGTGIELEKIRELQTASLPVAGRLNFTFRGSGPLRAPVARGELQVRNLRLGNEVKGDFTGQLASDGQSARVTLASEPMREKFQGELTIGFQGEQLVSGRLSVKDFDLDPFIVAGLHLKQLTGHSTADGTFTISGALRRPDSIEVKADISRISFNYEFVQLSNDGNIRLTYRRNKVRIEQAHLHGPETDFQLSGSGRFDRDRPLDFALAGAVNLRLLKGLLPELDARGKADVNVSVEGTMAQPQVTGRASVRDASAMYADFPVGLSKVNGDVVFNKSRLLFDRVTAESGGGQLTLNGSVTYEEGPLRYDITASTSTVRIRYPAGMSWLAGGTLQLSGTKDAALLSGRVQVERLLFAQGVDVASFFASAAETAPGLPSTSPFLRNLAFDVEGQTSPGARIEWTGAHIEVDGNVRLRGTWDRPVLLGHLHLLGGEMPFRGNVFELTRGDVNFANPFQLDPVLDVEATSTIDQYQVTIDFSGPASRLTLNYRSDPPLPDSDIVALLALGSTGEAGGLRSQAGAAQNYGATALLSEAISTGIGGRIEHLFGISHFRVDPFVAGTGTESNAAARVTIQQQVTHQMMITYSTNAATSNQYQLIQVEYALKRNLSVVFLRDINGTYGFDIKWVKHFK
jgi:translocation and assembly module TamB